MLRPLPPSGGKLLASAKICGFHDKGVTKGGRHKGALVEFETKVTDETGNDICRMVNGEFFRGIKDLGDIGPFQGAGITYSENVPVPARSPDLAVQLPIPNNAAHIYR